MSAVVTNILPQDNPLTQAPALLSGTDMGLRQQTGTLVGDSGTLPAVPPDSALQQRAAELFRDAENDLHRHTDHLFARLMLVQWLAGIAAALWISPLTWIGDSSQVHLHVWAAVLLGGAITGFPVWLALQHPGQVMTRHVIAVAQVLTSALLIHLTGGRIETHFHIFGSLAFLAFYRDWRVLVTATVVVAADHLLRGLFWPQSVFGVLTTSSWRWVEHAGWVLFEDAILFVAIRRMLQEMSEISLRRATLEGSNLEIERQVVERTAELSKTQAELLETSRLAGMAEVATSVLHNVGNVLNSVGVSAELATSKVREFRIGSLKNVADMLQQHSEDLPAFLTTDPRGKMLPDYLLKLAVHLAEPQQAILEEMQMLQKNIDHIKEIVAMQQSYARGTGVVESLSVEDLVEDSIRINAASFSRHDVNVTREIAPVPPLKTDRHKVMQILVNLLSNAKHALDNCEGDRLMSVRVAQNQEGFLEIIVMDNGVGIPAQNITRIFSHGFTTKKQGHGFGLHSGALAAKELGGTLKAHSDGPGLGATFTLTLPLEN
ncbi:ATP-binding protein [Prosthecobacter sp.]|uniref:sensor histidine kinase n=1 Tax=Prosthecobacter sp. TaxID=1965333 RepID=UPI0024870EF9|nr:ATP-binding protein [Prosthecobacter sp.]MDI1312739.1 ATP-binding protein [Prosthecobacter sp.]